MDGKQFSQGKLMDLLPTAVDESVQDGRGSWTLGNIDDRREVIVEPDVRQVRIIKDLVQLPICLKPIVSVTKAVSLQNKGFLAVVDAKEHGIAAQRYGDRDRLLVAVEYLELISLWLVQQHAVRINPCSSRDARLRLTPIQ